ncbi:glycosyltransferase, partial [Patescibacteria group bacterium]|nr:glycosyltransferase [Patescibacteria group bacterium]
MEENTTNISVIIPTASDLYLEKCLESVLNSINKYGKTTEIILVNNRPQNQEIKKIAEKFKVQYVEEKNPGSYRARNGGARKAQGDILAFCDVDCVVTENWLNEMEKSLANNEAVIGKTEGINENKTAKLEQMFYEMLMKNALVDTRNFGIKKSTFNHLGGFNEKLAFGGDMEFGARLDNQNFKIGRNEKMIVKHHNPTRIMKIILKRITQNFDNYN